MIVLLRPLTSGRCVAIEKQNPLRHRFNGNKNTRLDARCVRARHWNPGKGKIERGRRNPEKGTRVVLLTPRWKIARGTRGTVNAELCRRLRAVLRVRTRTMGDARGIA